MARCAASERVFHVLSVVALICCFLLVLILRKPFLARINRSRLSVIPAHYRNTGIKIGKDSIYGRVRLNILRLKSDPVYLVIGNPSSEHYRIRVLDNQLRIYKMGGSSRQILIMHTAASDPLTLEFSRRGGSSNLYESGTLVWSGTDLNRESFSLQAYSPKEEVRISVHRLRQILVSDDFARKTIGKEDAWAIHAGKWTSLYDRKAAASPNPFVCEGNAVKDAGLMLTGHVFWNNLTLEVAIKPKSHPEAGIVFAYRDENNYDKAVLTKKDGESLISLIRVQAGVGRVLAQRALLYPTGRWSRLNVLLPEGKLIIVTLDGVEVLSGPAGLNTFGKAGLFVRKGTALFDDFLAASSSREKTNGLRPIGAMSKMYSTKKRYEKDNRDDHLFRWAKDLDSWAPLRLTHKGREYSGKYFRLPLFGDFEFQSPVEEGGALFVVKDWLGKPLQTVPLLEAGKAVMCRRGNELTLNGQPFAASNGSEALIVGLATQQALPGEIRRYEIRSGTILQEFFENATVEWLRVDGDWENTVRWECEPKWTFFGGFGYDSVVLFSKHRFQGNQVHEFYFGMNDVFNREFEKRRYARHDVNFSFLTDGKDLFSGYTFLYGGFSNSASYLYRGRRCVATNDKTKFDPFNKADTKKAIFGEHLFWRRFRFETVGKRIRIFLEDKLVFDYVEREKEMPTGGHVALWTYRNGVHWARLNSSAEKIELDAEKYVLDPPGREDLSWQALSPVRVRVEAEEGDRVRVTNRFSGGEFAVQYALEQSVDLLETPILQLWMDIPEEVNVNLHLRVNGVHCILALTAPKDETYRVLSDHLTLRVYPRWRLLVNKELGAPIIGGTQLPSIQGEYKIDLLKEMKTRFPGATAFRLNGLIIGNTSHTNYLMAGLRGNAAGAVYRLGKPVFKNPGTPY